MRLPFDRRTATPDEVTSALELGKGERILALATDTDSGVWLVATTYAIALVSPGEGLVWRRPWHEVDRGSWEGESSLLTISWADRSRPGHWRLGEEALFLQTLRERVQASVVLTHELALSGRRTGRAVIRQDLATGALLEQVVLGRGVRDDTEVEAATAIALAFLREQVGLAT